VDSLVIVVGAELEVLFLSFSFGEGGKLEWKHNSNG
jgi:hypothetical protein